MAQNSDNIEVLRPKTDGAAYSAAEGTSVPEDASTALAATYKSLGLISEDGITMTINRETEDLKEMGGDVALTIQTEHSVEFKFKPMELMNSHVMTEMFGADNMVTDESTSAITGVMIDSDELPERVFVFDMVGREKRLMRVVIPRAKVTDMGDITFKGGDYATSELTMQALPDSTGVKVYIYFATAA